jgi:hypothetical protein
MMAAGKLFHVEQFVDCVAGIFADPGELFYVEQFRLLAVWSEPKLLEIVPRGIISRSSGSELKTWHWSRVLGIRIRVAKLRVIACKGFAAIVPRRTIWDFENTETLRTKR